MKKTLGMVIAELRKSQGMTQLELAEKMGVTDKAVSKWERDLSCPDIHSLPALAEILGVSVDELIRSNPKANAPTKSVTERIRAILKGFHFRYIIYLLVMGLLLCLGAVTSVRMYPAFALSINIGNIINFLDFWGIFFVLAVCLVVLICTKSLRPLKNAFVFMFRMSDYTTAQCEDCLLAVWTAICSALAAGGIMFLMSVVNVLKSMDLSSGVSSLGLDLSLGLLSLIYAFVIVFILLPIYSSLKRKLTN